MSKKRQPLFKFPAFLTDYERGACEDASRPILTDIEERWYINKLLHRDLLKFQKEEGYTDGEMISALLGILCGVLPLNRLKQWLSEYRPVKEREKGLG